MPMPKELCSCCGKFLTRKTVLAHSGGGGLQTNKAQFVQLHHGILPIQSTSQPRHPLAAAGPPHKRRHVDGLHNALQATDIDFSMMSINPNLDGGTSQNHEEDDMEYKHQTHCHVTVEDVTDEDSRSSDSDSSDLDSHVFDLEDEDDNWVSAAEWINEDFEKALDDFGALPCILT